MSEINKQVSKTVSTTLDVPVTADVRWISGETAPSAPAGYTRAAELDIDLGLFGHWWAFLKVS